MALAVTMQPQGEEKGRETVAVVASGEAVEDPPRPLVTKDETGPSFQPHEEHAKAATESGTAGAGGWAAAAAAAAAAAGHQNEDKEEDEQKQGGDEEHSDGKGGKVGAELGLEDGGKEMYDGQRRGVPLQEVVLRMSAVCKVVRQHDLLNCTKDEQKTQHTANELEVLRRECHLWRGECSRLWLKVQHLHDQLKCAQGTCKES